MRLLLVLLAALLAIGNAQHVNFRRMSSTGTDAGVKADTGYEAPVIGYLWRKYRTQLAPFRHGGGRAIPAHGTRCPAPISGPKSDPGVWGRPPGLLRGAP